MSRSYSVLRPPVRWTEDEPPQPHHVLCSDDDGWTWHRIAAVDDYEDACDIVAALDMLTVDRE